MGGVSMLVRTLPDKILSVLIILAISVGWAGQGYAQVSGATLTGTVKDTSGAVIPNAQVAITDVATGVSENFNVQFRAEIFNVLNRANFALPINPDNTDIFDSSGALSDSAGTITSTTTSARLVQFALKVIW
jgi:hypothetical protein